MGPETLNLGSLIVVVGRSKGPARPAECWNARIIRNLANKKN